MYEKYKCGELIDITTDCVLTWRKNIEDRIEKALNYFIIHPLLISLLKNNYRTFIHAL